MVARFLLDINVLLALAWPEHLDHRRAQAWFRANRRAGFATCPLSQLGFTRISSNPKFTKNAVTPMVALQLLDRITALPEHVFWPEPLSCREAFEGVGLIAGHQQLTDLYLLGLARSRNGVLATFDGGVHAPGELKKHMEFLGGRK